MGSQNKKQRVRKSKKKKHVSYGQRGSSHGFGKCKNTPEGYNGDNMKVIPRSKRKSLGDN